MGDKIVPADTPLYRMLVAGDIPAVDWKAMAWQPMKTAPANGDNVLLSGKDWVCSGFYDAGWAVWVDSRGCGYEFEVWGKGELSPIGWMPLPDPMEEA